MSAADPAQTFREEVAELLAQLEEALLGLEDAPHDRDLLDTAFRALHTIKGSGQMFGFDAAAGFAHHLENAFDMVRKGHVAPNSALIGAALESKDHIRALIEAPGSVDPARGAALLAAVAAVVGAGHAEAGQAGPRGAAVVGAGQTGAADSDGPATWHLRFRLAADAMVMGCNPMLLLDELRSLGNCTVAVLTEDVPALDAMDSSACYLAWDVVLTTTRGRAAVEEVFMFVVDDMTLTIDRVPDQPTRLGDILAHRGDVAAEVADSVAARQARLGAMLVEEGAVSEDRLRSALAQQSHVRGEAETCRAATPAATTSIRVPAERLDSLMDQVGELVIAQARLKQLAASLAHPLMRTIAEEIERLSNGLRDTTMGIRMVPIGTLFGRFRRLVRDLSQELGKDVRLTMAGEDTELDKTVIERLNDPLVHIIRNSLDHGVGDAADRARHGKPAQGHIHLSACQSGAQVLIAIADDGRGLDLARIRAKAEEQGLVAEGAALSDAELSQLIFHPGFSTARAVTSISGRGVGMDVVKRTIDSLRGTIDVASVPGRGTTITLALPLTLAIIDGLLVRVGDGRYVIPLSAVEECVELSPADDQRRSGRDFLSLRGDLVPFVRLRDLFAAKRAADRYQKVIIVSTGERRVGLVVDQVIGEHQTVIKSLSKLHADAVNFSGATIQGDGSVALILDIGHLVEQARLLDTPRKAS